MQSKHSSTSWLELSKSALEENIRFIKNILGDDVIFSSVVKGNAYGHDISVYCPLAYECGVRHFSVYSAHEAARVLESVHGNFQLLILGTIDAQEVVWAVEHDIEFYVINFQSFENAINAAKQTGKKAKIHIEFETGMNRTGFYYKDFKKIIALVLANSELVALVGVCTHLAGAESVTNYKRIADQIKLFRKIKTRLNAETSLQPIYHIACSAAILRYPKNLFDLARIGILQYGFFPNNETFIYYALKHKNQDNPLRRVISWKTKVVDIKTVKPGQFIGYGTSYCTNAETKIAIIPVGYGFGYSRSLSNHGRVLIHGTRQDVIGTINMNMLTVDVTQLDNVQIGDEVVLIGKQGEQEITVSSFSEFSNQLNYELLARLPMDIERRIVE